jgi:hypothetical protein
MMVEWEVGGDMKNLCCFQVGCNTDVCAHTYRLICALTLTAIGKSTVHWCRSPAIDDSIRLV